VIAPKNDIQEVLNANAVYENLPIYKPANQKHLLKSHAVIIKCSSVVCLVVALRVGWYAISQPEQKKSPSYSKKSEKHGDISA
jgi:hypothetical protein